MPALFWQNNRGYFPLSTNQPDRLSPRAARPHGFGNGARSYQRCAATLIVMKFENDKGEQVEVNFQNFERILPAPKSGYTLVKLKNGKEERLLATENEILEATAEE